MSDLKVKVAFGKTSADGILEQKDINDIIKRASNYLAKDENGRFKNLKILNNRLKQIGRQIQTNYEIYESTATINGNPFINEEGKKTTMSLRHKYGFKNEKNNNEELDEESKETEGTYKKLADAFDIGKQKSQLEKKQLTKLIAEAYFLIMKIRQSLLNENINYMIYVGDNKHPEDAIALEVDEDNILKLMSVGAQGISLRSITDKMITKLNETQQEDKDYTTGYKINTSKTNFYREFIPQVIKEDFRTLKNSKDAQNYGIIHDLIDKELKPYRKYLLTKDTLKKHLEDDHDRRHAVHFSMGNISEAFDIGYDSIYKEYSDPIYNYEKLRFSFYDNLYIDNIKATKGGDNAVDLKNQLSVKAFSASLYSINTIYGDLIQITDMIDSISSNWERRAKDQIESMFIEESKYKNAKFNKLGDKSVQDIINEAFSTLKTSLQTYNT